MEEQELRKRISDLHSEIYNLKMQIDELKDTIAVKDSIIRKQAILISGLTKE